MSDWPQHSDHDDRTNLEIERTYLLSAMPNVPAGATVVEIEQGYLPEPRSPEVVSGNVPTGRLRRTRFVDGSVVCTHTIKRGSGIERTETERVIDLAMFEKFWPHTDGRQLSKTRSIIQDGSYLWEIDAFHELNLHLAEVELTHRDEQPPIPAWLKPHIVREVTEEKQYRNHQLALRLAAERS